MFTVYVCSSCTALESEYEKFYITLLEMLWFHCVHLELLYATVAKTQDYCVLIYFCDTYSTVGNTIYTVKKCSSVCCNF